MTELSSAAQAVLNAAMKDAYGRPSTYLCHRLANALRAAAEQSVPDDSNGYYVYLPSLLAIADELDALASDPTLAS